MRFLDDKNEERSTSECKITILKEVSVFIQVFLEF